MNRSWAAVSVVAVVWGVLGSQLPAPLWLAGFLVVGLVWYAMTRPPARPDESVSDHWFRNERD